MSQTFSKLVREIIKGNLYFKVLRDMSTKTRNLVFLLRKKVSICQGDHKVEMSQRRFSSNFQFVNLPPLLSLQNFALFAQYGPKITTEWPQKTIVFHTLSAQFSNSLGKAPISLEMSPMLKEVRGTQLWYIGVWVDKTKIRCFYEKPFMILNGFIISKYGFNMFYSLMSNMFVKF